MRPEDTIPYGYCQCGCVQKTNLMPYNDATKGYVKGTPFRFIVGHQHRRFWLDAYKVNEETGCWDWHGPMDAYGYGAFRAENHKIVRAHRAVYERERGPIPIGHELDHLCNNRRCVNPDHLEPVTHAENSHRAAARRRAP